MFSASRIGNLTSAAVGSRRAVLAVPDIVHELVAELAVIADSG